MKLHSSECPVDLDEVAQGYVLGTLPTEQAIAFEEHYLACDTCATVLYKTVDYVDAMRTTARKIPSKPRNHLKIVGRSNNS